MRLNENERILVLGGSRGLGKAFVDQLKSHHICVNSMSRRSELRADFSKSETWSEIFNDIRQYEPTRIIYCAAGGPYGDFEKFEWKDHVWSFKVSFEFPAFLIHSTLKSPIASLKQFCVIGSAIAENHPDIGAAAYCASKHALKGLVTTLQKAGDTLSIDLRLLSPGYIDTDLLPLGSEPRKQGKAKDPKTLALLMIHSISDSALRHTHQRFD